MSNTAKARRALRRKRNRSKSKDDKYGSLGILEELVIKEVDARNRIGADSLFFVKSGDKIRFISLSRNYPEIFLSDKFFTISVGASIGELEEAKDLFLEIRSSVES